MSELKPCPFCGSNSVRIKRKMSGFSWLTSLVAEIRIDRFTYYATCNVCHARGSCASGAVVGYRRMLSETSCDPFTYAPRDVERAELKNPTGTTTKEEIIERAISGWNKRVKDDS